MSPGAASPSLSRYGWSPASTRVVSERAIDLQPLPARAHVFLQPAQRAREFDFLARQIGAERVLGKQPGAPLRGESLFEALRGVVAACGGNAVARVDLVGALRGREQLLLEARVGDVDHRRDALRVGAAAQVGDAVFGDRDVAQVARDRRVPVAGTMFDASLPSLRRVERTHRTERAPGSACAIATKLYWPPTPETTRPSASPSETAAPSVRQHHGGVDEARVIALRHAQRAYRRRRAG